MKKSTSSNLRNVVTSVLGALVLNSTMPAALALPTGENGADKLEPKGEGAQIECTTPDGRVMEVTTANEQNNTVDRSDHGR